MYAQNLNRDYALKALNSWLPVSTSFYRSNRNYVLQDKQTTSRLSPYISTGILSEIDIFNKMFDYGIKPKNNKYIEEIFWRIYFRGYLENRPSIWSSYVSELNELLSFKSNREYELVVNSNTGIKCFDKWTSELLSTGYLHNHVRMWYASIWIFTLNIPWQLGADLFLKNLIDADEASNTISWRWVAGLHTSKKPYLARPDNIYKYTQEFELKDMLAANAEPVKEFFKHNLKPLDLKDEIISKDISLIIHDNFYFHLKNIDINNFKKIYLVENPINYDFRIVKIWDNVRNDLLKSFCNGNNVKVDYISFSEFEELKGKRIVTSRPRVGLWQDKTKKVFIKLCKENQITFLTPTIDKLSWPYCKNGFFKLKVKIENILNDLDRQVSLFNEA